MTPQCLFLVSPSLDHVASVVCFLMLLDSPECSTTHILPKSLDPLKGLGFPTCKMGTITSTSQRCPKDSVRAHEESTWHGAMHVRRHSVNSNSLSRYKYNTGLLRTQPAGQQA